MKEISKVKLSQDINLEEYSALVGDLRNQPNVNNDLKVYINSKAKFQIIEGIGGSFSELGGKALESLPNEQKQVVAKKLFQNNLNYFRMPVGASDFALSEYSLNDNSEDVNMDLFSIDRDQKYLIPYMRLCKEYCNDMKLHASPWSAPYWLKNSNEMCGGGSLKKNAYDTYARYVRFFIKEYEKVGFKIDRYIIQNEPDVETKYPSMLMTEKEMGKFIQKLYQEFERNDIKSEIWAGTFRAINEPTACNFVSSNLDVLSLIQGVGVQYTTMQPLYDLKYIAPQLKLMHTESVCCMGENTWEQAVLLLSNIFDYMIAGCDVFTYWNMILNETKLSTWEWPQNSLVTINENTGDVKYNPDYYIMQLASKCLTPKSQRISLYCRERKGIAVLKPDKTVGFILGNFTANIESGKIDIDGEIFDIELQPYTVHYYEHKL